MRHILIALCALFIAAPAVANDGMERIAMLSIETDGLCRMGDGPPEAVKAACDTKEIYAEALQSSGYCFSKELWEWEKCK